MTLIAPLAVYLRIVCYQTVQKEVTLLEYREVKLVERLEQIESNLFRQMVELTYLPRLSAIVEVKK